MKASSESSWRECILTLIDVIGVRRLALKNSAQASSIMRKMHEFLNGGTTIPLHEHAYAWNDAVLLLAYPKTRASDYGLILREADDLKRQLGKNFGKSYAIAVKGKAFPVQQSQGRITIIEASSWALANCFKIEEEARRKKWRMDWYVDGRIAQGLETERRFSRFEAVQLMPRNKLRRVYLYDDYLWSGS